MSQLSLEAFRGMVQATPHSQTPGFNLVKVDGGFLLASDSGAQLKTARGSLRVFSSADTALNYVTEQISRPMNRAVVVRVALSTSLF